MLQAQQTTENPLTPETDQIMVVTHEGGIAPALIEGTLGGSTDESDSDDSADMSPSPIPGQDHSADLLTAAHLDNEGRRRGALQDGVLPTTVPLVMRFAMESAEACGRTGEEKSRFARELLQSVYADAPDVQALCRPGVLEAWMELVADASKGRLEINRPSRRYRWLGACIDSLRGRTAA